LAHPVVEEAHENEVAEATARVAFVEVGQPVDDARERSDLNRHGWYLRTTEREKKNACRVCERCVRCVLPAYLGQDRGEEVG